MPVWLLIFVAGQKGLKNDDTVVCCREITLVTHAEKFTGLQGSTASTSS